MASNFKKTIVKTYPRVGEKATPDTLYWKNLEFPITKKEFGGITSIDFSPIEPYYYAVTNSVKVQVFHPGTNQVEKTLSKFRDTAYSGSFRQDGKLLVAGGIDPKVKLFDVEKKALLRSFKGHTGPIQVTKFCSDNVRIMSGSDDKTVRIWDVPSEKELLSFNEHTDYIRCGTTSKASKDMILTGSYDHTVRVFDTRTSTSVLTVDHGHPVESVLMFPGGGIFISAGGNFVKVWDALSGGRLLAKLSNHHKTVTCLCFGSDGQRLLSGSLDRHVKIYDISTYQIVHTLDYPGPILSIGVAPDDKVLTVGMADGLLSIQKRKDENDEQKLIKKRKSTSLRYLSTRKSYVPTKEDSVIEHKKKEMLNKYDKYFRKFEYTKALDAALDFRVRRMKPEVTVSVIQELVRRGGIKSALAARDEKSLAIIVKFLQKNISNPQFMSTLTDVSNILLDLHREQVGNGAAIDDLLRRLQDTINKEVNYMKLLLETMGTMDTLFAAAQQADNTDNLQLDLKPSTAALETV